MFKRLSLLMAGLVLATACSAGGADAPATFEKGDQYVATNQVQRLAPKDKVEVVEVFSYGCIHCAHFEPYAEKLATELPKGAVFHAVPAAFNDQWLPYAQAFYAAKAVNAPAKAHAALFKAIHEDHYPLRTIDELADWYASNFGVDKAKFLAAANSDATKKQIESDTKLLQAWGIDGTPTIVVNGKYRSASVKSFDELNALAKYLAQQELQGAK